MPLGDGYTAEAQLTGREEHGGLQIIAYPLKAEAWERILAEREVALAARVNELPRSVAYSLATPDMGLGAGGKMRQEIYEDSHAFEDWDLRHRSRCFVHLVNSLAWRAITGSEPPTTPLLAEDYRRSGIPWFDYYGGDARALEAAPALEGLKGITQIGKEKGTNPLPDNTTIEEGQVVKLGPNRPDEVRDGQF
jgi:hypothetical protein